MRTCLTLMLTTCLLLLVACGGEEAAYDAAAYAPSEESAEAYYEEGESYDVISVQESGAAEDLDAATEQNQAPNASEQRRIIYNANIDLVVDSFEGVPASVTALARDHGGFVASSSIRGSEGAPRQGEWTLRIPSANYDAFVSGSEALGQVRSINSDSQEVTAEYVDLESRARNLRAEEERLHNHLNENTRNLEDILRIERELSRVRGDIERIEGRLNVLRDLTSLSTVTLSIEEIQDYTPVPTEEPGYAQQVGRTWGGAIDGVGSFLSSVSLLVVGLTPWLVVIIPGVLVIWLILRKLVKAANKPKTHATPAV